MSSLHGGRRPGAGRKPLVPGRPLFKETINLHADMWEYIAQQGEENYSAGLRKILEKLMAAPQVKLISKPPIKKVAARPQWQITMDKEKLSYDGTWWRREGVKLNNTRSLFSDHPELEDAEPYS